MKTGWLARRVARQVCCSDLAVRRYGDQGTEETTFTRRLGLGCNLQTSCREDHHITRSVEPTASLVVVQTQAEPSLRPPCLTEPSQGAWLKNIWTPQWYVHGILQPHVLLLMAGLPRAIFQPDSAQSLTAKKSQDCLCHMTTLPWPARSLNLSPIEHIWDHWDGKLDSLRVSSA
ncbi:transposable element Tcb1 transposase [Trichonephila clavipes]|nr:transposable element Tcb1 transposase [Trichonephila clavipes]